MKIHKREQQTDLAQTQLTLAVWKELENHDLTEGELIRVLTGAFSSLIGSQARDMIRFERHGNYEDAGGLE